MDWDPYLYQRFAIMRIQPGLDLLSRVPLSDPRCIVDLGCGPGDLTAELASKWPAGAVLGVDNSAAMLSRSALPQWGPYLVRLEGSEQAIAMNEDTRVRWLRADIAEWEPAPGEAPDLIYSNAALHWLPDHEALFPRLLGLLAPEGCLAVQMPQSWSLPSHRLMRETLAEGGVGGAPLGTPALRAQMARRPVAEAEHYRALLAPHCQRVDIWETVYMQLLSGEDPVYDWVAGAGLRPILEGLGPAERRRFVEVYRERLRVAYPAGADGRVPYPFERLFIVACV